MFSIVIPLYNKEKFISRAITSVLKQSYKNFELLIVNDGSTDNSLKVVNSIEDERIKVVDKINGGVSSARNAGIKEAKFDWVCFLDADDYWLPHHMEEIRKLICKYPGASIYSTITKESCERSLNDIQNSLPNGFEGYIDDYFYYAKNGTIFNSSSVCVKKKALFEIDCFDSQLNHGEDLDVWFKLLIKNRGVVKKTHTVVYDLVGENRAMMSKCTYENHLVSKIDMYRNDQIKYLNDFIDYFILRNTIPYYFSADKYKTVPNISKIKVGRKLKGLWILVYSDYLYKFNVLMYKMYKNIRSH